MNVSADNIRRGGCSALVLLPRRFDVDRVSSCDAIYSRGLSWERPDQARLASSKVTVQ